MKQIYKVFSMLFVTLFFIGCGPKYENIMLSDDVEDDFKIESSIKANNENGMPIVQVILKNKEDEVKEVGYKLTWLTKDGIIVDTILSSWVYVKVDANKELVVKIVAPNKEAVKYKIRFDYPNEK